MSPRSATRPGGAHRLGRFRGLRIVLLAGGGAGLLAGLWTGLARVTPLGTSAPVAGHGILMVLGFLGTLIALERAVALGAGWAYLGPVLAGLGTITLLTPVAPVISGLALTAAGLAVTAVYVATLRPRREPHLVIMAAGAVAWVAAAGLWTFGWAPIRLSPLLAAFLVLTIVGERLELSRLRMPSRASQRRLVAAIVVFILGVATTLVAWATGLVVAGLALVAQTAWLVRHDIARVTIRRDGLPRFAAACMLAGYVWLALGGLLWMAWGLQVGGPLVRDAALHAVFLGFAISMVMGHAPIILPAVVGTPLPHRRVAWVPLVVLHASVAARVAGDLAASPATRSWTGWANATALVLFIALTAATAVRARRSGPAPGPAASGNSARMPAESTTRAPGAI